MSRGSLHGSSLVVAVLVSFVQGCFMIGPDYVEPTAPLEQDWIYRDDQRIKSGQVPDTEWWKVFDDAVLDELVELAYLQNPSLEIAGLRVLEAQARRGIAVGNLFPQSQSASGSYLRSRASGNTFGAASPNTFGDWTVGLDAAWELDVWGRFRRAIESADAELLASVADYEDVLVSLIGNVAASYVRTRIFEERLAVARGNVSLQNRSLEIASAKFDNGVVTELDQAQARSLLRDTQALIPDLETALRQEQNTLCVLLGIAPRDLGDLLGGPGSIPGAPSEAAVGIPADLLRRRPDVRRAERRVAAQSARIGVAESELYPRFSLVGNISLEAEDFKDLFEGDSLQGFGGPSFRWAILNYGRIRNNVRVQDAVFQQLVGTYENTVLVAQREVEDSMVGFLRAQERVAFLDESAVSAERALDLSTLQYREGLADYIRVLNAQQSLLLAQDRLVASRGAVALNLVALYKALGGGWNHHAGEDFVSEETKRTMAERTNWGNAIGVVDRAENLEAAKAGTENDRGWWRWRAWWPEL